MQALQDLVAQCLQADPKARPSACKILKHKFFKVRRGDFFAGSTCMSDVSLQRATLESFRPALTVDAVTMRAIVSTACAPSQHVKLP